MLFKNASVEKLKVSGHRDTRGSREEARVAQPLAEQRKQAYGQKEGNIRDGKCQGGRGRYTRRCTHTFEEEKDTRGEQQQVPWRVGVGCCVTVRLGNIISKTSGCHGVKKRTTGSKRKKTHVVASQKSYFP